MKKLFSKKYVKIIFLILVIFGIIISTVFVTLKLSNNNNSNKKDSKEETGKTVFQQDYEFYYDENNIKDSWKTWYDMDFFKSSLIVVTNVIRLTILSFFTNG